MGASSDWLMYESRHQPLLSRSQFRWRLFRHGVGVLSLVVVSLLAGMSGYVCLEKLSWLDAFLNSSMLLGGMGPVDMPKTAGGKLFAGLYALYSGLVFLVAAAVIFAPLLHRVMHRLHFKDEPK